MASSFSAVGGPDALLQRLIEARRAVPSAAGGIVFVSGSLAHRPALAAELVRDAWRGVPACVVPAAGVISERGEIEGQSAATGLLWAGGSAAALAAPQGGLASALSASLGRRAGTALVFARPESFAAEELAAIGAGAPAACVLGGGTVGAAPLGVRSTGELLEGATVALAITGLASPLVEASPACRILSGFHRIEEVSENGLVLRAGGRPALELLSAATSSIAAPGTPPPVVLAALADPPGDPGDEGSAPRFLVRPVRGIDTARRGLMIGEAARPGGRLAFALRDAAVARAGLEQAARRVARSALGSAPRFALYLSCAGRGQGLYGAPDVEVRILRQRFADLPIAGMHSAFEITPWGPGDARLSLYTGVLALFRAPS